MSLENFSKEIQLTTTLSASRAITVEASSNISVILQNLMLTQNARFSSAVDRLMGVISVVKLMPFFEHQLMSLLVASKR
jgi:hypothetical protein